MNKSATTNNNAFNCYIFLIFLAGCSSFSCAHAAATSPGAKSLYSFTFNQNSRGKYFVSAQYARALHKSFGIGMTYKYTDNSARLEGTAGLNLNQRNRLKFTFERTNQFVDSKFDPYTDEYEDTIADNGENYSDAGNDYENNENGENGNDNTTNNAEDFALNRYRHNNHNNNDNSNNNNVENNEVPLQSLRTTKRIMQYSYGVKYQYMLPAGIFRDITLGGYYNDTPNVMLSPGDDNFNDLNIAGATVRGIDIGTSVNVSKSATLSGNVYYDDLRYNTTVMPINNPNKKGLGVSVGLTNIFTPRFKFSASASLRQPFDSYSLGFYWLPPIFAKLGTELSLVGKCSVPNGSRNTVDLIALQIKFTFGGTKKYQQSTKREVGDIASWVNSSAISMSNIFVMIEK